MTEESGGGLVQFTLGPRLTPHVRHRDKYVDVPVSESRAFVFGPDGARPRRARTLREFVTALESASDLEGYLRRGDFSRWIAGVFGDHALAADLQELEARHRQAPSAGTAGAIVGAVRARYEL